MELTGSRKIAGKLVVQRKNWQIPTKNCGKLTRKKFSFNCNRKKLIISRKSYYPIETFLKLVTIWRCSDFFFYRSNQYFVLHPRESCHLHSFFFLGFSFSFLLLAYVCHAINALNSMRVSSLKKLLE